MKKVTLANYKKDSLYLRVVRAVEQTLKKNTFVSPVQVFVEMGMLKPEQVQDWRKGRIPFLERVIAGNLSKVSRVLRILRFHVHDLNLRPSVTCYKRTGKNAKILLRFSKSNSAPIEKAWSTHFLPSKVSKPLDSPLRLKFGGGANRQSILKPNSSLL